MKMKKLTYLIYLFLLGLSLSACEMETSDNGNLDGFWQLSAVDTLSNGRSADMRQSGIYWGVQVNLISIKHLKKSQSFLFQFEMKDGRLKLMSPMKDARPIASEVSDERVMEPMELKCIGFKHLEEEFEVLQLTGSRMTLQNEHLRMYFRKY